MNEKLQEELRQLAPLMCEWMDQLHRHPEINMDTPKSTAYIASLLKEWGYDVAEGIGQYGIVATLRAGTGSKAIGLRADFDALSIQEDNDLPYKSEIAGRSHLCGHDAHAAMLLGAAKYLSEHPTFNGTARLIFQPGEETMQGGSAMVRDGLFERFPIDAVYGMHNMPGLPLGQFHFREGETMSAVDNWEILLTGKGCHGSMSELSIDPLVCGASLVLALQTIVSRNVSPWKHTVVNVGAFQSGIDGNAVPHTATLRLSVRNMDEQVRSLVLERIRTITRALAEAYGCQYEIREGVAGCVLVNSPEETQFAHQVACEAFGDAATVYNAHPYMASEDFAFMLREKKGCYCYLGNGDTFMVHHPRYVFNQDLLPRGAAYWVALVLAYLR